MLRLCCPFLGLCEQNLVRLFWRRRGRRPIDKVALMIEGEPTGRWGGPRGAVMVPFIDAALQQEAAAFHGQVLVDRDEVVVLALHLFRSGWPRGTCERA